MLSRIPDQAGRRDLAPQAFAPNGKDQLKCPRLHDVGENKPMATARCVVKQMGMKRLVTTAHAQFTQIHGCLQPHQYRKQGPENWRLTIRIR